MGRQRSASRFRPAFWILLGYMGMALLGALLLYLPISHHGELSFIDALFTATSALCVTGLIVKDTAVFWSPFGKGIILLWIEIGAVGYMTFAAFILGVLMAQRDLRFRMMLLETLPTLSKNRIWEFLPRVLTYTAFFEIVGFALLLLWLMPTRGVHAIPEAAFLSISAFANAGFAPYSDNMVSIGRDPGVALTLAGLLILGGLGFFVLDEIHLYLQGRHPTGKLSLHTRWVLILTGVLLTIPTLLILLMEAQRGLESLPWTQKVVHAFFQAATPRTAGFNTVDLLALSPFSLTLIMILMIVGGSPGGTAGGIKTTTALTMVVTAFGFLRGRPPEISHREISSETVSQATAVATLAFIWIALVLGLLLAIEAPHATLEDAYRYVFEVLSAFGTVGLSLGSLHDPRLSFSADFSVFGKSLMIMTMLVGRIGVLTVISVFVDRERVRRIRYIRRSLVVG